MNKQVKYALFAAILVMIGMLAGFRLQSSTPVSKKKEIRSGVQKLQDALWFIEQNYVEGPEQDQMVEDALKGLMEGLDPHSFYIPKQEMDAMEEQMQGSFDGIGVEFNLLEDTIYVVAALSGGPSEKVGIQAGDRIIEIEEETVAGVGITNSDVMKKLRGNKGTEVRVKVARKGYKNPLPFTITRDKIPLYSVDFSYMLDENNGYIKVSRFASTTHEEFLEAMGKLKKQGLKNLVLDLRGNPGGYMEMAQKMADEFLSDGKLVVYTEGRIRESKSRYNATDFYGSFEKGGLVILLDFGSASASEIVAGAVQDWDRGLILGVRSFGKGLVQTQHSFDDGSAIRLVISKYYTPSGRCIQKPYDKSSKEYNEEIFDRFESGEIYDKDKIELPDSMKYTTNGGRTVYGGGGIMPDEFIPRDTTQDSEYLTQLIAANAFREFSFHYGDQYPNLGEKYSSGEDFSKRFKIDAALFAEFNAFTKEKSKVEFDAAGFKTSRKIIGIYIKSFLGRRMFNDEGFYPVFHQSDGVLQKAIELMPKAIELEKTGKYE